MIFRIVSNGEIYRVQGKRFLFWDDMDDELINLVGRRWCRLNRFASFDEAVAKIKKQHGEQAGIEDFHFHDLKHCAITWMLEEGGYTREDLKSLGIQYNDKAIDRYRNYDADRTIERIKLKRNVLSDNCRTEAKNGTQNY